MRMLAFFVKDALKITNLKMSGKTIFLLCYFFYIVVNKCACLNVISVVEH